MPKFEIWQSSKDNLYYWHLKAANGEIVAQSEGYASASNCKRAIARIKEIAPTASVVEL